MKRSFTFRNSLLLIGMLMFVLGFANRVQAQCNCPSFPTWGSIGVSTGNIVVGQPVTFTVSTVGLPTTVTWSWCVSPNSGVTGIIAPCGPGGCNTRVATFNAPGTYRIVYSVTSLGIGSSVTRSNCRTVVVQSGIPNANFSFTNLNGPNNNVLPGNVVQFNNNSSQANGFSWNIPGAIYTNGTSPSSAEPEVFWNSGGFNSNVVLTATGVNGSDQATGSVAVQVPNVNPSFGFSPANPVTGQVVTLNNTTTGDGNPAQYNYNWTISGGPTFVNGTTPFSASPQILWNSTGLNSISLQACYQPGNYCASSGSQNVQVYTPVVADFTVNTNEQSSNSACTGFGVTTNNLSTGATNYTWSYSDGFSPNLATDFETAILFFNPGWQTITLTATNGPITDQHSVQVFVYDPYTITETYTPATNSTCSNGGLDVNITYNDPNLNPTSFSWWDVLTLTEIPGLNTNHLVANGTIPAGTYPVAYFDNIGCGKLVNIVIPCNNGSQPRLSTEPNEAMLDALGELGSGTIAEPLTELELYPNPTSNVATLSYQLKKEAEVQVSVFNSLGQEVTVLAQGSQAQGAHQLEVSRSELGLDAGIYFVRITASDQLTTQKLVLAD